MAGTRRWRVVALSIFFIVTCIYYVRHQPLTFNTGYPAYLPGASKPGANDGRTHWSKLPEKYPVSSHIPLPTGRPNEIAPVQAQQPKENEKQREERLKRRAAVAESFSHSWEGYKSHAWLRDEVAPLSGKYKDTFGGWAATLVDSLDTLWIMGMKEDFEAAVKAVEEIDFTTTEETQVNVFETTIRYMGGFLAAYDISGGTYPILLVKAVEVGELLMSCFDTPNRMPITRWDWKSYGEGQAQQAKRTLVSELGSLSLEFTRLSQLTGDPKYYDAVQRVSDEFEKSQNSTKLPGMWPISVDASVPSFNADNFFTLGGMSDSLYEYLPKQYLILGGHLEQPKTLYKNFIEVAKKYLFFRIYNSKDELLSVSGDIRMLGLADLKPHRDPQGQHLTCFTGGMVGLAARIFDRPKDLAVAEELTAGCVWAYDSNANGVAPELFHVMPCPNQGSCKWSDDIWYDALAALHPYEPGVEETPSGRAERIKKLAAEMKLAPGFTSVGDRRYILRPEAIESVFIMYRITGDQKWQDAAWRMFQAVEKVSRTEVAAAAIMDITVPKEEVKDMQMDSMESFWLAETLKYFYLCFEEFGAVSLDDYVLNTEAHPLRRPQ
ncbi:alpha-1,2-Mannosidase [Venustampulla echinocandica]|uniref:alpha-1,2-Mannosidase n=1 Tax=Venustampulla echinocandica TaxID=2656787 RepID=A0A370TPH5_9HELO|nr:alpha-1,2-Mannosidase [Venustampulla echinocandica]RDL37408.1 alpha-1,2-Mannosidase [Venustampulla echinocandica]